MATETDEARAPVAIAPAAPPEEAIVLSAKLGVIVLSTRLMQ